MGNLKPKPEQSLQKRLARRQLLKLLSAGATTALILPEQWQNPELTIAHLPPHAQTSGISTATLSNLSREIISPLQPCTNGGNRYRTTFNYDSPTGEVVAGTVVTQTSVYNNGITTSFPITLTAAEISGTAWTGSITYTFCATFATATSVTTTISLVTPSGGNTISVTMAKPTGAQQTHFGKTMETL